MTVSTTGARHLLFSLKEARLPDDMLAALRDEVVLAGWMRASGVLSDVHIKVSTSSAAVRRLAGPVQVLALEGSVGLANGDVSCGLRAVLAHETAAGELETIAGDIVEARIAALEVHVQAFDDVVAARTLDASGVWLLDPTSATAAAPAPRAVAPQPAADPIAAPVPAPVVPAPSFAAAVRADIPAPAPPPPPPVVAPAPPPASAPVRPSPTFSASSPMPARIVRPVVEQEEQLAPEAGDIVEHFAFGRCEVVMSDGDRLHVRLTKDQRIKEIALEMLKVELLPPEEGQTTKHYKLARRI